MRADENPLYATGRAIPDSDDICNDADTPKYMLPGDIWLKILEFCDADAAMALAATDTALRDVITSPEANLGFWLGKYMRLAYDDSHRCRYATTLTAAGLADVKREFPFCFWNRMEDFRKASLLLERINISGLWHVSGSCEDRPYSYRLELRQRGRQVYGVSTSSMLSVAFGTLRGNLLVMKQYCRPHSIEDLGLDEAVSRAARLAADRASDAAGEIAEGFLIPWSFEWLVYILNTGPEAFYGVPAQSWSWSNVCSAVVDCTGNFMRGIWFQEVSGLPLLDDQYAGSFTAEKGKKVKPMVVNP